MTHEEFRAMYESGEITVKIFEGEAKITPYGAIEKNVIEYRTIEAFEHAGKYFLRIHVEAQWSHYGKVKSRTRRLKDVRSDHYIKEFENKFRANAYFKKLADGYNMKRV